MVRASEFPIFAVTVDVVAFTIVDGSLHVLVVERGQEPFKGRLALPGGFVTEHEELDAAARRELREETGVRNVVLEQLATYGSPKRDPRPERVVSVAHLAVLRSAVALRPGSDATEAHWRPVAGLRRLAFDHDRILSDGVERLKSKLEYTAVAASFLDQRFTLADLRGVYESVWGQELDPGNFQRKLRASNDFVVETTDYRPTAGRGRPGRLFKALKTGMAPLESPIMRG